MKTSIVKAEDFGLESKKANELTQGLDVPLKERELLITEFNEVSNLEINKDNIPKFRELRLKIQKNRTQGINKWHKSAKEWFLSGGKFVDATKRLHIEVNEKMESKLMDAEKYYENLEKERLEKLQSERVLLLSEYVDDAHERDLSSMEEDVWTSFLETKKQNHLDRIKAELKAEKERIAKEKAEKEEQERIKKENEKLKKEAEERERLLKLEEEKRKKKEDEERKVREEKEKKERAEYEAKLKAEREAKEKIEREEREKREKLEAELKAKEEAEKIAEDLRVKKQIEEENKRQELAKAPIKKQLKVWVDSFEIPDLSIDNEKHLLIKSKFDSFKKWSLSEIEKM